MTSSVCESVLTTEDGILRDCHHDTYNRAIYKPKFKSGDPQQINVQVGGEFLDIAATSPLVASAASFTIHRIYYDDCIERQ